MHARRDRVASAASGTNQWIWSHDAFREWERMESGILWIEGKPGSGKSTLAKTIQAHLHLTDLRREKNGKAANIARFQSPLVTDHFYSARQLEVGINHEFMLRSLLYQLLIEDATLFPYVQDVFRTLRERSSSSNIEWSWECLEKAFLNLHEAHGQPRKILCILDALDESKNGDWNKQQRTRVLKLLRSLCRQEEDISTPQPIFKFIVLSRPAREISRSLRGCHKIELHKENGRDIRVLVDQGLKDLRELMRRDDLDEFSDEEYFETQTVHDIRDKPCLGLAKLSDRGLQSADVEEEKEMAAIKNYLVNNAKGVILWVCLMIGEAKVQVAKGFFSFHDLHERLRGLPIDLEEFYSCIVKDLEGKHDKNDIQRARSILLWVSFARRPLTVQELWDAVAVPLDEHITDFNDVVKARVHRRSLSQLWLGMLELCGPFIEVTRQANGRPDKYLSSDNTVQLVHQTVKEFLVHPMARALRLLPRDSEWPTNASRIYLEAALPVPGFPNPLTTTWTASNYQEYAKALEDRPLISYCAFFICKESPIVSDKAWFQRFVCQEQVQLLLGDQFSIASPLQLSRLSKPIVVEADQYQSKYYALDDLGYPKENFDVALGSSSGGIVDISEEDFRCMIFVAACQAHLEGVVKLLLQLSQGTPSNHRAIAQALILAAKTDDVQMATLLRKYPIFQAKSGFKDIYNSIIKDAVIIATTNNSLPMVKALLDQWPGRVPSDGFPLHIAAASRGDDVELVEYLCWKLVNIDCLDSERRTSLDVALARGSAPIIRFLRSRGAQTLAGREKELGRQKDLRLLSLKLAAETAITPASAVPPPPPPPPPVFLPPQLSSELLLQLPLPPLSPPLSPQLVPLPPPP
jgi:hypothetical protein